MKGSQGRRGPLSGLRGLGDRFTLDALRKRQQADRDREDANALENLKAQVLRQLARERTTAKRNFAPKRGVTKRPMAKVKAERRHKRKLVVRGKGRKNQAKRVRYLRREKARTGRT